MVEVATGATDLLVVRHRRGGGAHVDAEAEVGFVVAHAQRRGGDHRLDAVLEQLGLHAQAIGPVHGAGVFGDVVAGAAQEAGEPTGLGHGEHVDDARAGQRVECLIDPREALDRRQPTHHRQLQ